MTQRFAVCIFGYSNKPEDFGVSRRWYVRGEGDNVTWSVPFNDKLGMPLDQALAVYNKLDSPVRRMGLVPV